ncbi:MAG: DUF2849 domain-containing protein [Alphaproteobacteria bacterium]|nr:DUF2849 domain-containing protein [Alphaproteobacteria bacterium]
MTLQVVTANRLRDGDVVYLTAEHGWALWLDEAAVAETEVEAEALLKFGEAAEKAREVIRVYLMKVERMEGKLDPLSARERIRAKGPTTRRDLGKQADNGFKEHN